MIERFRYEPITTVYLKYEPDEPRLPALFNALVGYRRDGHHGQWAFNRGALDAANRGVLALVISTRRNPRGTDTRRAVRSGRTAR